MRDIKALLDQCYQLGATLTLLNDHLKVQAPNPLPDEVVNDLREAKRQVINELRNQRQESTRCWMLEEWRRVSLPQWRNTLQESISTGDKYREEYARWMLNEFLEDSDCQA